MEEERSSSGNNWFGQGAVGQENIASTTFSPEIEGVEGSRIRHP
jgi:hypothetical protein